MKVLLPDNNAFDLNQPTSKLIDNKMCVLDYSDKEYVDFFFKKITTFISYRYPTVDLLIGHKFRVTLPLNWRIMVTNSHDYLCRLIPVEELLHFENQIPIFNPLYVGMPKIMDVEIEGINPNHIEHFVPKLPKKNILCIPVGNKSDWTTKIYSRDNSKEEIYPECIYACDDIDTSKCELDLYTDIID